ncbi:restriction endonuclease [Pseudomonas chlororaphis]|uniref:restriction endonuclease n=1 Tax=Pseudomonas chlororaphis TaxID=587753 RepID=UPI0039E3FD7F
MLDFTELPKDGTKFEQLVREVLLKRGLRPHWTGKGPDSGRDLLVEEPLQGEIQDSKRLWLVDCKHYAHSNRSVGVVDVVDIRDRCERVKADGYLLACSTTTSSELTRKLGELSSNANIATEVWDSVTIERLLLNPSAYSVAQQFFPISMASPEWKMFYTEREERWMAHFRGYFLYVESRAGIDPPSLIDLETIIQELKSVHLGNGESLRVRGIWHDTPNGPFYSVAADYLVPSESSPALTPSEIKAQLDEYCVEGGCVTWHIKLQITLPQSDYYSPDDPVFYSKFRQPLFHAFYGVGDLDELAEYDKWTNLSMPPIRTFNDQLIWEKNKENFGYKKMGELSYREI